MSYNALYRMRESIGLQRRITAAAAQEGLTDPEMFTRTRIWEIVSDTAWVAAWAYAEDTMTVNHNPDVGARDDVINDEMVLAAVQALIPPPPPPPPEGPVVP